MRAISLLVFSTVYLSFTFICPAFAAKAKPLDLNSLEALSSAPISKAKAQSSNSSNDQGFCYEIFAGSKKIGFVLETKTYSQRTGHKINKSYTNMNINNKLLEESLSSTSDPYLTPLSFQYQAFSNHIKTKELSGVFKKLNKTYQAEIKVQNNKKQVSTQKLTLPKGTVFQSRFIDLIFSQKKIEDIEPDTEFVLTAFNEKTGKIQTTKSQLNKDSDVLKLVHSIDDLNFSTEHLSSGELLKSLNSKQNIALARCESVSLQLKLAESQKNFKSLFAKAEKDILTSCCQL